MWIVTIVCFVTGLVSLLVGFHFGYRCGESEALDQYEADVDAQIRKRKEQRESSQA